MPLKRLVLVSFILSSFLQANEEIQKSFFKESESLSLNVLFTIQSFQSKKKWIFNQKGFLSQKNQYF